MKQKFYTNRLHRINAALYVAVIIIFAALASYYSYMQQRDAALNESYNAANEIYRYHEKKHEDFWTLFLPAFQDAESIKALQQFMDLNPGQPLTEPLLRGKLVSVMNAAALQDPDIKWILFSRDTDEFGYLFNPVSRTVGMAPSSFPFLGELKSRAAVRSLHGAANVTVNNTESRVYGIAGSLYNQPKGALLAAYDLNALERIYNRYSFSVPTQIVIQTLEGTVIYDSGGTADIGGLPLHNAAGRIKNADGHTYYAESIMVKNRGYMVSYIIDWHALGVVSHRNTPLIWEVGALFSLLAAFLYFATGRFISRRVGAIIKGLDEIGANNLSFRYPVDREKDEFSLISGHINRMNGQIEENIQRLYVYQLRQKAAELGELQAKFNPHFLYNTLEVIRSELQEEGNAKAAQMIMLLARIFRGFLSSRPFVSISEEISYCNAYLELFKLRYQEGIRIEFDVEQDVLGCGIIRNLLQPILENFFVHGFDPAKPENVITITGRAENEAVVLAVADNGLGMNEERLSGIRGDIGAGRYDDSGGYGLININERIRIFYGGAYGLAIDSSVGSGTVTTMRIRRMSLQEHEKALG